MSSTALSPTTKLSQTNLPVTTKEFGECIKYFQNAHRSLMRLNSLVNKLPHNQPLKIGNHEIRKSQLNKYSQAYIAQLGDLRKMYANRTRKNRKSTKINTLFYVSDQLVEFYKNADLGKLDPGDEDSGDLRDHLSILTEHRIATSGILTSLMSRYIDVNNLKSKSQSGRFVPDDNMKSSFKSSEFLLPKQKRDGTFSKTMINLGETRADGLRGSSDEKSEKLLENISLGKQSAFERIKDRVDKRRKQKVMDKNGLLYTTMMVFNNFYRIPPALINEEEEEFLHSQERLADARELQDKLSFITNWHRTNK